MGFISSGVEKVRAFELPCGSWADGGIVEMPRMALVKWCSSWSDKFYQVYVNGKYAGTTVDSQQRQMLVQLPACLDAPVKIEVFGVEAGEVNADFSNEVDSAIGESGRVKINMLRSQNLPIGATAGVYYDGGSGEIDYETALNDLPIRIWAAWQDKAGFGMSKFGASDFGYDSAAAAGFGKGSFGNVEFGFDNDILEWVSPFLQTGVYKFAVEIVDESGNRSSATETGQVTVIPAARSAKHLNVSSFDKQTNQLVLSIA